MTRHTKKNIAKAKVTARVRKEKIVRLFKKVLRILWKPKTKGHQHERFLVHLSDDSREYYIQMHNASLQRKRHGRHPSPRFAPKDPQRNARPMRPS